MNIMWIMQFRKQDLIYPSFLLPFPRSKCIDNVVIDVGIKVKPAKPLP